ncbi:hypothetical protein IVA88_09115 [Bradyrhizobium sp. 149]|uniref:hypothetical protein n=1 Tax=Bradyrhizobium sp. 149 TaxID=2782624 RepID=UPI001FFB013E|nr:hypothetical protein [Bradyrhizobium sp. 149]MCK1651591.1 hypothetical protein [Bradyrhizobium sp. 149]
MKVLKSALRSCIGLVTAGVVVMGGASAAMALTAQFQVTNSFGATLFLDTASCTGGGSISPPFSISAGGSPTFSGSTTGTTTLCTVRYQSGSFGCQFQVQVLQSGSSITGFASTNAYKGSGGRPSCTKQSDIGITNGWSGGFTMQ